VSTIRLAAFAMMLVLLVAARTTGQSLAVAAASDLQAALPSIAARFEKDTGVKVGLTFGSSGNFFTQIQNGAPFDVFLSADADYPRSLEQSGHAVRGSLSNYATGRLVLWTRLDSGIDIRQGLRALLDAKVRRIAVANPLHAPYGRAAVAALQHEQIYDQVRQKLVPGESVSQAAQFAQSGSAEVGLLAMSLALSPAMKSSGAYVEIPDSDYPLIEQAGVVLARSRRPNQARQFIDLLKEPAIIQVLLASGFAPPAAPRR
jgi:molybdate transport system substrate-binding protein